VRFESCEKRSNISEIWKFPTGFFTSVLYVMWDRAVARRI